MKTRKQHFVTFYSPGTFVAEMTTKPIGEWSAALAARMASDVTERYNSKPYGFRFSTSIVADPVSDGAGGTLEVRPKQIVESGMYHLGGELLTYDDVRARNDPKENILRSN